MFIIRELFTVGNTISVTLDRVRIGHSSSINMDALGKIILRLKWYTWGILLHPCHWFVIFIVQ